VVRLKTQDLNVDAGTAILFRTLSRTADSFISTPRYVRNEGMPEDSSLIFSGWLVQDGLMRGRSGAAGGE
jgi:hypothetical protein